MKTIICGPRDFEDYDELLIAIDRCGFEITEVVSGAAKGADSLGERWAKENGVKCIKYPAKWNDLSHPEAKIKEGPYGKYNCLAGFFRNEEMAMYAEACIAIIHNDTKGTADMVERAKEKELELYEHHAYQTDMMDAVAEIEF